MIYILYFLLIVSVLSIFYKLNFCYKYFLDLYFHPFIKETMRRDGNVAGIRIKTDDLVTYYNISDHLINFIELATLVWVAVLKYNTVLFWVFFVCGYFNGDLIKYIIKTKYVVWGIKKTSKICVWIFCVNEIFGTVYYIYLLNEFGLLRRFFS